MERKWTVKVKRNKNAVSDIKSKTAGTIGKQ